MQEASQDSLDKYAQLPFQMHKPNLTNDAMEMLKASALIQKIDSKELVMQVIHAYSSIKLGEQSFLFFMNTKKEFQSNFKILQLNIF